MLSKIRNKSKGWIAYLIIGLITIPFAFFGIQQYIGNSSNSIIASVDGEEILLTTYYKRLNLEQRNLQQQFGSNYSSEVDASLRQMLIDGMIQEKLLENYADSIELVTLDEEVRALIQSNELFQVEGVFSEERYNQLLRLNNHTPLSYEIAQAGLMKQDQLKRNLVHSAFLTSQQIKKLKALAGQQRYASFIVLNTEKYKDQMSVTQDQVTEYFDTNQSSFVEPPKIKVKYVELSLDDIEEQEESDKETLRNLYDEDKELFTNPEQRSAQHILVDAKELAESLLEEIQQGADFSELARIHSIDTSTKDSGGNLGYFERDIMVPEFDKAVFEMSIGELSEVVETDYGYHIIRLTEIQPENIKSFEESREQLASLHQKKAAQLKLYSLQEELGNLAYEDPLDLVAEQLDLELETSEYFSRTSKEYEDKFVVAAYSDLVLNEGENSDVIELGQDRFVVLNLADQIPERQKTLDEVKIQITDILKTIGAKKLIDDLATKISASLSNGENSKTEALIAENELEWSEPNWISRNSELPLNMTSMIFKMTKPSPGESAYSSNSLNDNITIVIGLKDVRVSEEIVDESIADGYLNEELNELFINLIKELKDSAEIKVYSELL
ncbi:MAG: SurA N-terminal domain-containing protein [Candidatus Thioglobus sp.]|jgi:peptidyl-prolyl cis-trans isomerase D|nr:SurA N-terminal domain-containing protein [Candidatus Thioglobus sp.]